MDTNISCDRPGLRRRRAAPGPWWTIRAHRPVHQRSTTSISDSGEVGGSLLDDFPDRFTAERDSLDLLLHAAARLIETTDTGDDIGVAGVFAQLATSAWARYDRGPHTEAAAAFLTEQAAWLVAYAAGTPGIDLTAEVITRVLGWIDASPRPLRAQILRAAAARYLG